jgi:hypothetical protein
VSWDELCAYARQERDRRLAYAAAWRASGTPVAIQLAKWSEARALTLDGIIARRAAPKQADNDRD